MNLSEEELKKFNKIVDNVFKFTSEQIGMASGHTTGYESVLLKLRTSAAELHNALQSRSLSISHIDKFESDVQTALIASPSGMFSSFKSYQINPDEISEIIKFLDLMRDRVEPR